MEGLLKEKDLRDIVCDLHIHTSCSDGGKEASFVLEKARQQGVSIISITDHNNIDAYSKLKDTDKVNNPEYSGGSDFHQKIGQIEKKEIGCQLSQKITLNMFSQVFLKIFSINFAKNNKKSCLFLINFDKFCKK